MWIQSIRPFCAHDRPKAAVGQVERRGGPMSPHLAHRHHQRMQKVVLHIQKQRRGVPFHCVFLEITRLPNRSTLPSRSGSTKIAPGCSRSAGPGIWRFRVVQALVDRRCAPCTFNPNLSFTCLSCVNRGRTGGPRTERSNFGRLPITAIFKFRSEQATRLANDRRRPCRRLKGLQDQFAAQGRSTSATCTEGERIRWV